MYKLKDESRMPWGKYKGYLMKNVPASYFHFFWTQKDFKNRTDTNNVAAYINENLNALKEEHPDGIWE